MTTITLKRTPYLLNQGDLAERLGMSQTSQVFQMLIRERGFPYQPIGKGNSKRYVWADVEEYLRSRRKHEGV